MGAGVVAAAVAAIDPFQVHAAGQAMTETLFSFFLAGTVFFLLLSARQPSVFRTVLVALCIALAGMTRPAGWGLAPLAVVLALLQREKWSLRVARALLVIAICAAVAAPWVARNWIRFRAFIPTTTHGGYTLVLGNNKQLWDTVYWGWGGFLPGEPFFDAFREDMAEQRKSKTEVEFDRAMWQEGLAYIREHPDRARMLAKAKFRYFWRPAPSDKSVYGLIPAHVRYALGAFSILLYAGSVAGLVFIGKDARKLAIVLWPAALFTMVHMVVWSQVRFRVPLHPLMAALAGVAASALYVLLARKEHPACAE